MLFRSRRFRRSGPGRAGGGEELGGLRGVFHYMQRTALQGDSAVFGKVFAAAEKA